MKDKKITSKGLASAFLSHIQDNNFDEEAMASLVEAARRWGFCSASASDDDETESLITPLERESMTAREQKIWAMSQGAIRRMQLMKANPVAFDESAAQAAEAEARCAHLCMCIECAHAAGCNELRVYICH
eukprot:scaffold40425_cov17-Tisochrysis_lutea.AAC.1